jgi:hypothetical protein
VPVRPRGVGVGDDDVAGDDLTGGEAHSADGPALDEDLLDRGAVPDRAPEPLHQVHEAADERAGAADGKVNPPLSLEIRDQAVDGRRGERVATDEQRVKAQHLAQALVFYELRDEPVHGSVALELHHRRDDARHVRPLRERNVGELVEADGEDLLAHRDEALVPLEISRREPPDLGAHPLGVARVVERPPVVKADPIKRR